MTLFQGQNKVKTRSKQGQNKVKEKAFSHIVFTLFSLCFFYQGTKITLCD